MGLDCALLLQTSGVLSQSACGACRGASLDARPGHFRSYISAQFSARPWLRRHTRAVEASELRRDERRILALFDPGRFSTPELPARNHLPEPTASPGAADSAGVPLPVSRCADGRMDMDGRKQHDRQQC
jgi:hypothetical protein